MDGALGPHGALDVGQSLSVLGRRVDRRGHAVGLLARGQLLLRQAHLL